MTPRQELNQQLAQIHHDIGEARRAHDLELVNLLERLAPLFELEVGPLCRCEFCLQVA